jgi:hypothetical protein
MPRGKPDMNTGDFIILSPRDLVAIVPLRKQRSVSLNSIAHPQLYLAPFESLPLETILRLPRQRD